MSVLEGTDTDPREQESEDDHSAGEEVCEGPEQSSPIVTSIGILVRKHHH